MAIFMRLVRGFLAFVGVVGIGGGEIGGALALQLSGRRCIIGLDGGSLLSRVAYLLVMRSAWYFRGGTEASISRAWVGVVLKAAQVSLRAFLCTFSKGLA